MMYNNLRTFSGFVDALCKCIGLKKRGNIMAFSGFKTISEVQEKFRITYTEDDFFKVEPASPSAEFLQDFEFTRAHINVFASEAALCI